MRFVVFMYIFQIQKRFNTGNWGSKLRIWTSCFGSRR